MTWFGESWELNVRIVSVGNSGRSCACLTLTLLNRWVLYVYQLTQKSLGYYQEALCTGATLQLEGPAKESWQKSVENIDLQSLGKLRFTL